MAEHKYSRRARAVNSLLCVGLDVDYTRLTERWRREKMPQFSFARAVIEETHEYAAAYKINPAFFESRGLEGLEAMQGIAEYLRTHHSDIFFIYDGKRGDVGHTMRHYTHAAFDWLGADALTLVPYIGGDALEELFSYKDKHAIVLCRTSNPNAGEVQDLSCDGAPLWQRIAELAAGEWGRRGNVMLVVGATAPKELERVRAIVSDTTILVPGVGAQGGDVQAAVAAGVDAYGEGLVINASRSIIFSEHPGEAARELRDTINRARK